MHEERLLERIRSWEKEPNKRTLEDPGKIIDSVLRHLRLMLNTRRGSVQILSDYGMPDLTGSLNNYSESLREIEKIIRNTIQKYEPRLNGVKVNFTFQEDDLLSLSFHITARLVMENEKIPVMFESCLESDGKVDVKR